MPGRILLVDDEPQILASLRRMLSRRGYDVTTAPDATQALLQIQTHPPDVVISDFKMPGMNGAELLAAIASSVPRIRCVLLSGYADVSNANFAGTFLRKPWNDADILSICALGALA